MLLYNPDRNPEQKLVMKNKTEFCFTGYEHGNKAIRALSYVNRDSRPSWERYGSGTAKIDIQYCDAPSDRGWLSIIASEVGEGKKSGKEVYITLPKEAVDALRDMLNRKEG